MSLEARYGLPQTFRSPDGVGAGHGRGTPLKDIADRTDTIAQAFQELEEKGISIEQNIEGDIIVHAENNIDISPAHPLRIPLTVEKVPLPPLRGDKKILLETTIIDTSDSELQALLTQAEMLSSLSEQERPRALLNLLRSRVAYDEQPAGTSRAVQQGKGNCADLTSLYLVLAQKAGMQGTYESNGNREFKNDGPNSIKNVYRYGTSRPLFTHPPSPIGEPFPEGHAWAELRMSDGTWLPVDPATRIIGDNDNDRRTFHEANYRASVDRSIRLLHDTRYSDGTRLFLNRRTRNLEPAVGSPSHTGIVELHGRKPYRGPVHITLSARETQQFDGMPITLALPRMPR